MQYHYPTPQEIGLQIPNDLIPERYCAGFRHALQGGKLNQVKFLRKSFRLGFRTAKLFLREVRRRQGIIEFPLQGRFRFRALS